MPDCLGCGRSHADARTVLLHDGTPVSSYSEAWRIECEARSVLAIPSLDARQFHLRQIERIRGKASADALRSVMLAIWQKQRAA